MNRTTLWIALGLGAAWLLLRPTDPDEPKPGTVYVTGENVFMRAVILAALIADGVPHKVVSDQWLAEVTGEPDFVGTEAGMMVPGYTVMWVGIVEGFEVAEGDDALRILIGQAVAQSREILG